MEEHDIPQWVQDLPDYLKNEKTLYKFPDDSWKEKLAKSYIEAEKKIGGSISLPKDDDEESWNRVFERLGKPKDASEYEAPEGVDEDTRKLFSELAYNSGLTKKQYKRLLSGLAERQRKVVEQGLAETKKELGDNLQKVDTILEKVSPELKQQLYQSNLVSNAAFMKEFAKIITSFDEDKPPASTVQSKPSVTSRYDWMKEYFGT